MPILDLFAGDRRIAEALQFASKSFEAGHGAEFTCNVKNGTGEPPVVTMTATFRLVVPELVTLTCAVCGRKRAEDEVCRVDPFVCCSSCVGSEKEREMLCGPKP